MGAFRHVKDTRTGELLIKGLSDSKESVREAAIETLGYVGDENTADVLRNTDAGHGMIKKAIDTAVRRIERRAGIRPSQGAI